MVRSFKSSTYALSLFIVRGGGEGSEQRVLRYRDFPFQLSFRRQFRPNARQIRKRVYKRKRCGDVPNHANPPAPRAFMARRNHRAIA